MPKFQDLTGQNFGKLTVLELDNRRTQETKKSHWICKCDCGKITSVTAHNLKTGHTKSCGCLITNEQFITHGKSRTRLYNIWSGMKRRCYSPSTEHYNYYGGSGITICDEWRDNFQSFYDWSVSNGYSEELSIDRIDNSGNYCPSNCRWATKLEQARNKRNITHISVNGVVKPLYKWSEEYNIPIEVLRLRYKRGRKKGITDFTSKFLLPVGYYKKK